MNFPRLRRSVAQICVVASCCSSQRTRTHRMIARAKVKKSTIRSRPSLCPAALRWLKDLLLKRGPRRH
jgi:hypothetical protein